ncbi:hypothetical protein SKAU_G00265930 [Synaphobranchus kaupii]|uniref:15-hydroxyprostaglandin dehydrogenase n=1 Tax=Synaphobranchus kaupii TaxID=118154 RepID=A0A9Q1EZL2_SYNKA|nr:hypothetical protein SKAU_G00265930 [Synaphobranchus kaupii]
MALSGKVALLTGAGQGLGKGFSDILLKNGAKVALLDINETAGKNTKADFDKEYGEDRIIFLTCDVTSDKQLKGNFIFIFVILYQRCSASLCIEMIEVMS